MSSKKEVDEVIKGIETAEELIESIPDLIRKAKEEGHIEALEACLKVAKGVNFLIDQPDYFEEIEHALRNAKTRLKLLTQEEK